MRKKKNTFWMLPVALIILGGLFYMIYNFSPEKSIKILIFNIPSFIIFFSLLFLGVFTFFTYLLKNTRRGFLIALMSIIILLLRNYKLGHIFFIGLIIIFFVMLEYLFTNRK